MRSRLYAIISIPLFAILYCYTAVGVLIVLIFAFLNMKTPIRFLFRNWAKSVFLIMGKKFTVNGMENIKKGEKYILVANHGSLFDIVAITSFYPDGLSWFGHERLLKVPIFKRILIMTDYIPFRKNSVRNTKEMLDMLVQKSRIQSVAMFPEGTRTLDGKIKDFYKGFIHLFRTTETGILPVTLNGFYQLKPKNRFYINFDSKLNVVIHRPIIKEELKDKSDIEIIDRVRTIIESAYN
jgi:1-acyl-sn-glycerol-3-phosphate acyltransferase